ncbi:MAG TPA: DinB family protein [Pseudonocardiaceae bacterium]|jgi:uncharacterized damage-inducible protein DinB
MTSTDTLTGERADILETLAAHRFFLRNTTKGMTEEQIRQRSTVSELTLGVLIKHVADMERRWVDFILEGPSAMGNFNDDLTPEELAVWASSFQIPEGATLADLLAEYDKVAQRTDELVASLPDLDAAHPLPEAPWFQPGAKRSARRVLLHIVAETAQHAGHADIIREAIDGQKSMG